MDWADWVGIAISGIFVLAALGHLISIFSEKRILAPAAKALGSLLLAVIIGPLVAVLLGGEQAEAPPPAPAAQPAQPAAAATSSAPAADKRGAPAQQAKAAAGQYWIDLAALARRARQELSAIGGKVSLEVDKETGAGTVAVRLPRTPPQHEKMLDGPRPAEEYYWRLIARTQAHEPQALYVVVEKNPIRARKYGLEPFLFMMQKWLDVIFPPAAALENGAIAGNGVAVLRSGKPFFMRSAGIRFYPLCICPDSSDVQLKIWRQR